MIYTSYFANLKNLPDYIVPISICGKAPDFYKGIQFKILAPKYDFFKQWKVNQDNNYYIYHFNKEVLNLLDPKEIEKKLYELSNGSDIALICYEKPDDFCHRHLVANWFNENNIKCEEYIGKGLF